MSGNIDNVMNIKSNVQPIVWRETKLLVLDQKLLPYEKKYLELTSYKQVIGAIKDMTIRGAPLIGIAAAYGMAIAADEFRSREDFIPYLKSVAEEIKSARPTAINLKWAVDLIMNDVSNIGAYHGTPLQKIIAKRAIWIHEDDANRCQKIGENGLKVITPTHRHAGAPIRILTICNTGALATGGIGTAFGVILTLHLKKIPVKVFACETRPRQQGARLTTFECIENGINCTLISDTAYGYLMQKKEIDVVITGADRIAASGDVANKIGTYQLAVLAKENNIPFYVAAPLSTFDLSCNSGKEIPIEERDSEEVTNINGKPICAHGTKVRNPAFDITPAKYISGIITEKGILSGNYNEAIKNIFNEAAFV